MIGISTPSFDTLGDLLLEPFGDRTEADTLSRRVNKEQTLDGDVSLEDRGYTPGDRTLRYVLPYDEGQAEILRRLIRSYPRLLVSTREAVFETAPTRFQLGPSEIRVTLEVKRRRSP